LKLLSLLLLSFSAMAASVIVKPFEMELYLQKGYKISGEIELACRYERTVWSDSAEYETFYQTPQKLKIVENDHGEMKKVKIIHDQELYYEYDRFFRTVECRASFKFLFESEKYARGIGVNPYKPVSFSLWKGMYDYQEGDQYYDLRKMTKYLDNTTYTFKEVPFNDSHINIWIKQDGKEADTSPWVDRAYINPETGKPYSPRI